MTRKVIASLTTLLGVMGLYLACAHASLASEPAQQSATRSVYCNVYLDDACFGIAQGDTLTMEIPSDFVLDTVRMGGGIQATIYKGYHPKDVFAGKAPKNCPVMGGAYQCRYVKSASQYDLLYQATANAQVIHMHIDGVTEMNSPAVTDFLSGFRRCHATGQSVQCTEERLFKGIP